MKSDVSRTQTEWRILKHSPRLEDISGCTRVVKGQTDSAILQELDSNQSINWKALHQKW